MLDTLKSFLEFCLQGKEEMYPVWILAQSYYRPWVWGPEKFDSITYLLLSVSLPFPLSNLLHTQGQMCLSRRRFAIEISPVGPDRMFNEMMQPDNKNNFTPCAAAFLANKMKRYNAMRYFMERDIWWELTLKSRSLDCSILKPHCEVFLSNRTRQHRAMEPRFSISGLGFHLVSFHPCPFQQRQVVDFKKSIENKTPKKAAWAGPNLQGTQIWPTKWGI